MLIPDLLNIIFDQSNYKTIIMLSSLHKRKTAYACKYSLLSRYNQLNNNKGMITEYPQVIKHIVCGYSSIIVQKITDWVLSKDGRLLIFDSSFAYVYKLQWSADPDHLGVVMTLINLYRKTRENKFNRAHQLIKMFGTRQLKPHGTVKN